MKTEIKKEHSIMFKTDMVKAVLYDKYPKTQTRRCSGLDFMNCTKPETHIYGETQPEQNSNSWILEPRSYDMIQNFIWRVSCSVTGEIKEIVCPYGKIGEKLWVKETWYDYGQWYPRSHEGDWDSGGYWRGLYPWDDTKPYYYADNPKEFKIKDSHGDREILTLEQNKLLSWDGQRHWEKRSAMFMWRWVSRIDLQLIDINLERLWDINDADAQAEGIEMWKSNLDGKKFDNVEKQTARFAKLRDKYAITTTERDWYFTLWDSINVKKYPVKINPWLWKLTFKRIKPPMLELANE